MSSNKKTLIDGDFQVGSNHFVVDTVNNYVGFNNATPQNKIDVQIGARTGTHSTGKPLYVTGVTSTSGAEFVSDDGTAGIGIGSSNIFTKGTNQNITIAPDGTGAVGIKTATPNPSGETFDLWVQGDTKITGNVTVGTIIGDGSGLTNIISSQWDSSSEDIYFLNNSGSGSGRVAVGTSTPVSLLTLEGTSGGAPPTTGQEGTSNALVRVRDDNNVTLDIGTSSGTSWLQSSDATAMGTNYAISINPNGGNVGVGTISPNVPLEVNKSAGGEVFRLTTSTGTLYAGADADPPWFGTSSDDHLRLMTNGTEKIRIESGGNVGIGITSPGFSLDVDGDINFTGNLYEGGSLFVNTPWTIETSPDALNYTAGNVGIGTTTAAYTLDVDGDINFTGDLYENGSLFVNTPWTIETSPDALNYTAGNVGIGGANPSSTLEVTGNTHISSNLSVGGTLTINTITAAALHSLQAVTDVGNVTSNTVQFSNATTGLVVDSNIVVTGNVTAAFLHGDASNVTAVPSAQITGTLAVANGGTGTTTSTGTGSVVLSDAPTFTGDVTFDTNTLFVDSVNDRVGVGTNSPEKLFEISGASGLDNSSPVHFRITNTQSATSGNPFTDITKPSGLISFYTPDTSTAGPGDVAGIGFRPESTLGGDTALCFYTNSENDDAGTPLQERMCITHDGNAGIGTTNPVAKLNIQGTSEGAPPSSGGEGTSNGIFRLRDNFNVALDIGTLGASPWTTWLQVADTTSMGTYYPLALQPNGGNVGIGTTNPGAILDVAAQYGEIAIPMVHFRANRDGASNGDGNVLLLENSGNRSDVELLECKSSGNTRFVVKADGNVGIGTDNPGTNLKIHNSSTTTGVRQYSLHVSGSGADIVPLINASSGGLTVETVAGIEITSVNTNLSLHGRHAIIESVSAGGDYNTDMEFLVRNGGGYQYSKGGSPATKQARISHDGKIYARVGTSATGADYAELFEWNDGNPENEDRTGMTVKLMEGGKIGIADANTSPEDIIGVISVIYGFLGNDHWDEWVGKYLKDSLGRVITETVDMVTWRDEDDKEHTFAVNNIPVGIEVPETATYYQDTGVPKINPNYDKTLEYTGRSKRKEWGAVGLVGRLRVLKTYPKSSRWVKLQDIDNEVEEYLAI